MNRNQRLQKLLNERFGGNQASFAKAINRSPAQINHWLTGHRNLGDAGARHIEITLNLGIGYFDQKWDTVNEAVSATDDQILTNRVGKLGQDQKRKLTNLKEWNSTGEKVPLISWVQAGAWQEAIDNFHPGDADEWFMCPVNHSDSTYVLQVRGESMYNPSGRPSFQEGDLIFVDPQRSAEHGSLVVVRLDDQKEVTFKKLIIEGGKKYLKALNPDWPEQIIPINGNATMCGVVIFKGEKL